MGGGMFVKASLIAWLVLIACLGSAGAAQSVRWTISADGYGPIRFGMTIERAEALLGTRLVQDDYNDGDECRYFTPLSGHPGVAFMASMRKIVRVDVNLPADSKALAPITDRGAKIGDSEARVLSLYKGHIKVGPHFYTGPEGHYMRVYSASGKVRLIFETDGHKVQSYRSGREPAIEYVEGCQ